MTPPPADPAARPARPLRRDARRNRERLLAAATEVLAERGLGAPLEQVAERAGVGIGTLYRHFPTRDHLLDAILDDLIDGYAAMLRDAVATAGTWEGFRGFLERAFELHAEKRSLYDLLTRESGDARRLRLASRRAELRELLEAILGKARSSAGLRPDFTREDLALLFWAHNRIVEATAAAAPHAWRRHLELLLDALRADRATPLRHPPLTAGQLAAAAATLRQTSRTRRASRAS